MQSRIEKATAINSAFYEELSSPENQSIARGLTKPVRVRAQPCDQVLYLVDGKDRITGNSFNFQVDCGKPLAALSCSLTRVCVPKLPNINAINNSFTMYTQITNVTGGVTGLQGVYGFKVTLPIGFYNQTTIQTNLYDSINSVLGALEASITAGLTGGNPALVPDTFNINYNTFNKTVSISSYVGNKWFFDSTSPFIVYGKYLTGFLGYPGGSNMATVGQVTQYSGPIGLMYSRYIKIKSNRLMSNALETCRTTSFQTNVVAVISLIDQLTANDFSTTNVFTGSLILDSVVETTCQLNVAYFKKQLGPIDFQLTDEYDFPLDYSLNFGAPYDPPQFDVLIWMNFTV